MNTAAARSASRLPPGQEAALWRQLADLTGVGLAPAQAIAVLLEDAESSSFAALLGMIGRDLEQDTSLAKAMERHAPMFSPQIIALIREADGRDALAGALAMLADDQERDQQLRAGPLVNFLAWPLALLVVLAQVMLLMMVYVAPAFKAVFFNFGAELPGPTQALVAVSDLIIEFWWMLALLLAALAMGVIWLRRHSVWSISLDRAMLKLPGAGRSLTNMLAARVTALLAGAASHGIAYAPVFAYLRSTLRNRTLIATITALQDDLAQGTPLPAAWRKQALLPRRIAKMLELGADSGTLAPALARAAQIYGAQAERSMAAFRQTLFSAIYILVAILVAALVTAMYLPIFKLGAII